MRYFIFFSSLILIIAVSSCQPERGCMDETADNYNASAEKDDGTCIPSRDKMIGDYTYTRIYKDADSVEYTDFGNITISEASSGYNDFVLNLNGQVVIHGTTDKFEYTFETLTLEEEYQGLTFERTYSGEGHWLTEDSVDTWFVLSFPYPVFNDGPPPYLTEVTLEYSYFLTKLED